MTTCPACGKSAELLPILSILDFQTRALCAACIDAGAEPQSVVIKAATAGWDRVPIEIRRAVRVFDQGEYVTPAQWSIRTRERREKAKADKEARDDDAAIREAQQIVRKIYGTPRLIEPRRGWAILSLLNWRAA